MTAPTCDTCSYYEAYEYEDRGLCKWQKYHRLPKWMGTNPCLALVMKDDDRYCETRNNPTGPLLISLLLNLSMMNEEDPEKKPKLDNLVKLARMLLDDYD